jgi:hypothetical protein
MSSMRRITAALYEEVARLGAQGYAEASWELRRDGNETVLVVKDTSLLKTSADTDRGFLRFDCRAEGHEIGHCGWFAR